MPCGLRAILQAAINSGLASRPAFFEIYSRDDILNPDPRTVLDSHDDYARPPEPFDASRVPCASRL
jgi:hypothetical protein